MEEAEDKGASKGKGTKRSRAAKKDEPKAAASAKDKAGTSKAAEKEDEGEEKEAEGEQKKGGRKRTHKGGSNEGLCAFGLAQVRGRRGFVFYCLWWAFVFVLRQLEGMASCQVLLGLGFGESCDRH